MRCAACGTDGPDGARFCGTCGAGFVVVCAACGAPVSDDLRFCTTCGARLPAGDVEASGPTLSDVAAEPGPAERRRVSILFVDLEGFTTLAESLDPEEVRGVQSRYFEAVRAVVAGFDGTIEKFIGDAVMAVWGAPAAHEDDPERAVRAAIAIVDEVSRLGGAVTGAGLRARAGVASGEAAVTIGAHGQGMLAGDLVNVAARLQPLADPGGVLVDDLTRELAPHAATYEPIGSVILKGRTAGVSANRATSRLDTAAGRVRGAHTGPIVGRDGELRELIGLYQAAAQDRQSRLVSITGIAGIGKSRLAWEFGEWIEALPDLVAWHAGRAPAYGDGITFAAVAEMVRRRIRVADDAPPGVAHRQLAATLDELVRDEGERRWIEPRVAVLLDRDEEHAFERDELFAAWRRFFERVSDRAPTVLLFEDLQWADPALLDFVEHLAAWTRDHPILIVALARPELHERRPGWGGEAGRFTGIHLERLPDEAMRTLLLGRAPQLPEPVLRSVLDRAGGVPLYAVEVVRALADREPAVAADVPDSIAGLIASRIDALPGPERRMLLSAAVLGRRFRPDALAAVTGTEPAALRERLETLLRRDMLELDQEPGSPGRGTASFVQDLVRDVAYRTLGHADRRAIHLAAARWLEAFEDGESTAALARHLVQAHRLAPNHPDAPRIARRAVAALRLAARDDMRLHVPHHALERLAQGLELAASPEMRDALLDEAAAAARAAARLDLAEQHLRALVAHREGASDAAGADRARAQLASVLLMAQRNETALLELEAAIGAVKDAGSDPAGVELAAQLARARLLVGDAAAGLEWADRAIRDADRLGLEGVAADAIVTRATARVRLGDHEGGLADMRRAIEMAQAGGLLATELRARNNLAWLLVADDPRATLETAREGFELATEMGIGDLAVQLGEVACAAALDTGEWDWALATTDEILSGSVPDAVRVDLVSMAAIIGSLKGDRARVDGLSAILPIPAGTDEQVAAGVPHAQAWDAFVNAAFLDAQRLAGEAASSTFGEERVQQLALAARAGLWRCDATAARAALADIRAEAISGRAVEATIATLEAGLTALERGDALDAYGRARDAWAALDLPLHLGLCLMDAGHLMSDGGPMRDELEAVLARLGADGLRALVETPPCS